MSNDKCFRDMVGILEELTRDWDLAFADEVSRDTRLIADLEFESIDVVQFIVAVEEHYQRRDFPFEDLMMEDGRYVEDLGVGQVVDFVASHLEAVPVPAEPLAAEGQ